MQILSNFNKRSILLKVTMIFLFVILLTNSIIYLIQPFSSDSIFQYYTKGYFSFVSSIQQTVFGIIPISLGDILYIIIASYLLFQILNLTFSLILLRFKKLIDISLRILLLVIFIWLLMGSQWNWNYSQPSLSKKMSLDTSEIKIDELADFTSELITKTIENKESTNFDIFSDDTNSIIDISTLGYKELAKEDDFYNYKHPSIKYSLFSSILPSLGISGYYNPFTSEAQITKNIPIEQIPFVVNHEIAHQLGIASEDEANFIGYLSSINNPLSAVKYSGNLNLLMYCLSDLKQREYKDYDRIISSIPINIKDDINKIYLYWRGHRNNYRKYFDKGYDNYLKSNNQKEGLKSYNKVVSLAIFYNRKN